MKKIVIKPDAKPIDNIKKFAWDDEDYIEIEVPDPPRPKPMPNDDARITELEAQLAALTEGYVEGVNQA